MNRMSLKIAMLVLAAALLPTAARAQDSEQDTVEAASRVLKEIMATPDKGIPAALLNDAQGVAIIPSMINGGFIVGVERGKGVVLWRDAKGAWGSPNFVTITGGGIGWQAGIQSSDVILVFRTKASIEGLKRGKFTIGADASAAAGPVGRNMSAGTDGKLQSEIYSYSRSRGLFAGLAINGAVMQIDNRANADYYGRQPQGQYPQSALNLVMQVAAYSSPGGVATNDREALRRQLVDASRRLQTVLDPQWQRYLSLPPELYDPGAVPAPGSLMACRERYQWVAGNPSYRTLTDNHEFQETLALLNRYLAAGPMTNQLKLPPPPQ